MALWRRWVERPQGLWLRKALFQVHLWTGVAAAIYVLIISVSGSAIVCRREITRMFSRRSQEITNEGRPMLSLDEQERNVQRRYPEYDVIVVRQPETPSRPDEVVLVRRKQRRELLFDPYTGADLGNARSPVTRVLDWLVNLHDNLLAGMTGRALNGLGAFAITLLGLTGSILWWPGKKNWRRSVAIRSQARFARLNWDLHSAIGFWSSLLVLVWGISGVCLCFPGVLDTFAGGTVRLWVTALHFGRFNGLTEVLWTVFGLAPAALAITGVLMWWNRVLLKKLWRCRARRRRTVPAAVPQLTRTP